MDELTRHWQVNVPLTSAVRDRLADSLDARFTDDPARLPAWALAYDIEVVVTPTTDGFVITASRLASDDAELPATKWSWVDKRIRSAVMRHLGVLI